MSLTPWREISLRTAILFAAPFVKESGKHLGAKTDIH